MKDWSSKYEKEYREVCYNASFAFGSFKRNEVFNKVLEHVSYNLGRRYYSEIVSMGGEEIIDLSVKNDQIGKPIRFDYGGRLVSPTTLRYLYVSLLIKKRLPKIGDVVEIGGGYGGQALLLRLVNKMELYYDYDFPEAQLLARSYLAKHKIIMQEIPPKRFDFVVSCYAWSELGNEARAEYLKIISKAKHGLIIINPGGEEQMRKLLSELYEVQNSIEVLPDLDRKHPFNRIVQW